MKNFLRMLWLALLTFVFLGGGRSLFSYAAVEVESQNFNLWVGVTGEWNKDTQQLILIGSGKINAVKWNVLKTTLSLESQPLNKIEFTKDIKFPDNADMFFHRFKTANIIFDPHMDTSNVTSMSNMFSYSEVADTDISNWDVSNVTNMYFMFRGAKNFNSDLSRWNVGKVTNMIAMFHNVVKFNSDLSNWDVSNVTTMAWMFHTALAFNSDLSRWNTSKVTTMNRMFRSAVKFNSDISNWDVSKVTTVEWMFANATSFNQDLSKWTFSSLNNGSQFLLQDQWNWPKMSFSTENHDKLLKKLEADYLLDKINPAKIGRIAIQAPYCISYPLRDKLKGYGFRIYADKFDCNAQLSLSAPTKESNWPINDVTISFSNDFPLTQADLDAGVLSVDTTKTTLEYSDFNCSLDADPKKINCTIKITSTHEEGDQKLVVHFLKDLGNNRKIETFAEEKFLIDTQAPNMAQPKINTTPNIHKPEVSLMNLPTDQWAAGTDKCELKYTDSDGAEQTVSPMIAGNSYSLNLNPTETVHALKVTCYDKVGNSSTNEMRFPPIIEFSDENVTLSKGTMNGKFSVYSPSESPITNITLEDPDGTAVALWTCKSQSTTSAPYTNSKSDPVICEFDNITKSWVIIVKAKDTNWAEGQSSQSFVRDNDVPSIDISPEPLLTGGNLPFKITVTDDNYIIADQVKIVEEGTTLDHSNFTCEQKTDAKVECSFTATTAIINGELKIQATDKAGNSDTAEKSGYTIDKVSPIVSDIENEKSDQGKKRSLTFQASDEWGAGLWKESEMNDIDYDDSAISYGIGDDETCANYGMITTLSPQSTEPFKVSFDFTDATQNGKYLCVVVKDKVGNTKTASLAQININLAPTLSDQSVILNENTPVGNEFFTIAGYDPNNGDTLSYTIEEGNTGNVFAINQNKLKVNWKLDYKTLSRYTLMIKVSDQFWLFATGRYTITLNNIQPSSGGGYSWGGGLSSHTPTSSHTSQASTSCPNGNCSWEPVKTEAINTELFNPTIKTSCFSPLDKKTIDQGNKMTELMRIAHQMLYSYQLTKWQGTKDFAPERSLTRDEAARFMTEFATNVLCRKPSRSYNANFIDLEDADPTLIPYIKKSYEYLIFNGDDNADGKKEHTKFRPRDLVSVNELAAIMTRLVRNELMEEVKGDWARNYKLYLSSITPKTALVDDIRGNIAEVIYDLYRNNAYELKEVGYVIKK